MDRRTFVKMISAAAIPQGGLFTNNIPIVKQFASHAPIRKPVVGQLMVNLTMNTKIFEEAIRKNSELIKEIIRKHMRAYLAVDTGTTIRSINSETE